MSNVLKLIIVLGCVYNIVTAFKIQWRQNPISLLAKKTAIGLNVDPSLGIDLIPRRFSKFTKQIATVGPASNYMEMIEKLFLSGADIFRLNFSHGEHAEKAQLVDIIRAVEAKYEHPITILGDLQGPKLRVGIFDDDKVTLVNGQRFSFDLKDEPGSAYRVRLPHPEILNTLDVGDILLLDDGKLRMKVVETTMRSSPEGEGSVVCDVLIGGKLSNKKGVNTPSIVLPISPLTPKDRRDLDFILTLDIDWVALSFVQRPEDIIELKNIAGNKVKVMAKLEKPSAVGDNLEPIVDLADGVMVARGDLGVEMNPWDVPVIQKRIVETCKFLGKPVVIATQMMESMIEASTPTRAEASDCATAIYDSCDAVMLSAESAAGKYPVESVTMQQLIINRVETDSAYKTNAKRFAEEKSLKWVEKDVTTSAITIAARQVADISKSKYILAFTSSGGTVMRMARMRPTVPIIAACYDIRVARQLTMCWGVYPIMIKKPEGEFVLREELLKATAEACRRGFVDPDADFMTVTAGLPFGVPGTTNVLRVISAAGPDYWFDSDRPGQLKLYEGETGI